MMSDNLQFLCNWENCQFQSFNKKTAIKHVIINHADLPNVPFYCNLCGFRGMSMNLLRKHIHTYKPHIQIKDKNCDINDEQHFKMAKVPYNVTWGQGDHTDLVLRDVMATKTADTIEISEEIITIPIDETEVIRLKEEIATLKAQQQVKDDKFGNYVQRIEGRLARRVDDVEKLKEELCDKDKEIYRLKSEIRSSDPFVQGFEELWEDTSPPKKKIKSVVRKLF